MTTISQRYNYDPSKAVTKEENHSIYKGYDTVNQIAVLIIELKLVNTDPEQQQARKQEYLLLIDQFEKVRYLNNRNISRVYDIININQNKTIVIMQYCQNGSLITYLKKEKFIDQQLSIHIMKDICTGLIQLHKKKICHGYINLENIQVDSKGNWKLSMKCLVLKAFYLSPEFKIKKIKGKEGDIFSLGTALYKMMYGVFPYSGKSNDDILQNIKKGQRRTQSIISYLLPFPIIISKKCQNLVFKMINYYQNQRPTAQSILSQLKELQHQQTKNKKYLDQIEKEYIVFHFNQKIEHQGYYSEIFFTGINKKLSEFIKIKFIDINVGAEDKAALQNYQKNLDFFKEASIQPNKTSFIYIKQSFITKNSIIIIYQYFNQNNLDQYCEIRKQTKKNKYFEEVQSQQIGYYIESAMKYYLSNVNNHTWVTNKHIYIKQGKLKISQPYIQSQSIKKRYSDMKNIIDFLAPEKKRNKINPQRSHMMDIWTLGINVYKLLFDDFPIFDSKNSLIFPNSRSIKIQLKKKLSFCLTYNEKERQQIKFQTPSVDKVAKYFEISKDQAKKMIEKYNLTQNKFNLIKKIQAVDQTQNNQFIQNIKKTQSKQKQKQKQKVSQIPVSKVSLKKVPEYNIPQQLEKTDQQWLQKTCIAIRQFLSCTVLEKIGYFQILNLSWTRKLRYACKIIITTIIHVFCCYYLFISTSGNLLINAPFYTNTTITMRSPTSTIYPDINFTLVTKTPNNFTSYYNQSLSTLKYDMNCARDNFYNVGIYGNQLYLNSYIKSNQFQIYLIFGYLIILMNLLAKSFQIAKLDFPKLLVQIKKQKNEKKTKILKYVFTQMALSSVISIHYLLYGSMYFMSLQPCLQNPQFNSVKKLFSGWIGTFMLVYIWEYLGLIVAYSVVIYLLFFLKKNNLKNYVWIFLFILYLLGLGTRGLGGFVSKKNSYANLVSLCGVCGQILQILNFLACGIVDYIFWKKIDKKDLKNLLKKDSIILTNESNITLDNSQSQL